MVRPHLPLNALRAFEASARHLSFTRAAIELHVTQAAVSHQVKLLEERVGVALFKRLPRGLLITAEGEALLPVLTQAFDRMAGMIERFEGGAVREVLHVGAVGTFAVGWLLPRLAAFHERCPFVDLRLSTNNNRVDMAAEGLDLAVRFGGGAWAGIEATRLFEAPLTPLCVPRIAATLRSPADLAGQPLLRSYRSDEWPAWFAAAGQDCPPSALRGTVFDSSLAMMEAALQGAGVALCPPMMFARQLSEGAVSRPFAAETAMGSYWLARLQSRTPTAGMEAFGRWIREAAGTGAGS